MSSGFSVIRFSMENETNTVFSVVRGFLSGCVQPYALGGQVLFWGLGTLDRNRLLAFYLEFRQVSRAAKLLEFSVFF